MKHLISSSRRVALPCLLLLLLAAPALAQWTDGQAAANVIGQPDFMSSGISSAQDGLLTPYNLALDVAHGKLYVADQTRVMRYAWPIAGDQPLAEVAFGQSTSFRSAGGGRGSPATASNFSECHGLAVDAAGNLWVADPFYHRVTRFNNAYLTATNGVDADLVLGQTNFTSSGSGLSDSTFSGPYDVEVDAAGVLWILDSINNRVLRYDNPGSLTNGAAADGVLGQALFTTNSSGLTASTFDFPQGLASSGTTLWVADQNNQRLLRFDTAASRADGAAADGVLGQTNFTTQGQAVTQDGFSAPRGLFLDNTGRLYVADTFANRVVSYDAAASKANGANADNVFGQALFTTSAFALTSTGMRNPNDVLVDSANDLLIVADTSFFRVLIYQASSALPVGVVELKLE